MNDASAPRATFRDIASGTQEDWTIIGGHYRDFAQQLPDRILKHLKLLDGDYGGFPVDRLQHCLQTAALAHRDGRDEEYVVCALLHDIGDTLGTYNHANVGAMFLQPFISEENYWMVDKHGIFQGYYFFHYLGMDRNAREAFRGHPHYERTAEFCAKYDGPAFDVAARPPPLEFFEPMVRRVYAQPKNSMYSFAKR